MFQRSTMPIKKKVTAWLVRLGSLCVVFGLLAMTVHAPTPAPNYLHTSGNKIVDASGTVVGLSGVNWFGFETSSNVPHGLWTRNWQEMLDQVKTLGYNVIRLPFSSEMLTPGVMPSGINYTKNPDLVNLSALEVMDRIIAGARDRNIRIILDNHRSTAGGGPESNGLWYTSSYPETRWIEDWKMLAHRYKGDDTVIGMDLRNEPYNACWGCGDPARDWKLAAERAGNAILSVNPDLLIIVEGVAVYGGQYTWWGGNLIGARNDPVTLQIANRLVYSPHEYPASVYPQPWFNDPNYPDNLPAVWDKYWGYLSADVPILVGEFGTKLETTQDRQWFQKFQSYIQSKNLNWTFWSLNPDSGDTGGLLLDDWLTVNHEKQNTLKTIQYPFIGSGSLGIPTPSLPGQLLLDDFESNGLQNWNTFRSDNSYVLTSLTSPGQTGTYALNCDYSVGSGGWAGTGRIFTISQAWNAYPAITFEFYGTNSGSTIRFEILDNFAVGSNRDAAERFEYKFTDNFTGWKTFALPWNLFSRRADWQPAGAPNDGLNLTAIWGFNFSPVNGQGSFRVDHIRLSGP